MQIACNQEWWNVPKRNTRSLHADILWCVIEQTVALEAVHHHSFVHAVKTSRDVICARNDKQRSVYIFVLLCLICCVCFVV